MGANMATEERDILGYWHATFTYCNSTEDFKRDVGPALLSLIECLGGKESVYAEVSITSGGSGAQIDVEVSPIQIATLQRIARREVKRAAGRGKHGKATS
jgi:hypothetical protein